MTDQKAPHSLCAELTVPGTERSLGLVRVFVREAAELGDLPRERVDIFVPAAVEAFTAIAQRAFDADEPGTMTLRAEMDPAAWTLCIREHGLPLDSTAEDGPKGTPASAAWQHIHDVVDEVHWRNLGPEGSEVELVIERPHVLHVRETHPDLEMLPPEHEVPAAPPQEYTIRRMRPEEAIQVAQCVYRAYGFSYPNKDLYYPSRIAHLNETGELISVVAVDEAGEVVGHLALERPDLQRYAESGQAVVMPAHRGRHLLERMREFAEEEGRRLGLALVWSEPVTSHPYSQRMNEQHGSRVSGVVLGAMPGAIDFKKLDTDERPARQSCMFYVKYLDEPVQRTVHAPQHHQPMLERIYDHLGTPVTFAPGAEMGGPGRVAVSMDRTWGTGLIRVTEAGTDTVTELQQALQDLVETAGAQVIYLELSLSQPGTPHLCQAAEELGFFFGGVAPDFASDGDALRLQYLDVPLDISDLKIASPFGQEIANYAARERDRVQRGKTS